MTDAILKFDSSFENRPESASATSDVTAQVQDGSVDWQTVTSKMANGDRNALTTFYNFNFDVMLKEVKRCSGRDEQTCLDLVQDAMLKAIKSIKPIGSESHVKAWSRTVAKSVTYDWLRKRSRLKTTELFEAGAVDDDSNVVDMARLVWIESELKSLPHSLQKMIELRYRLGWSLVRIGEKFGLKTGAVDGRIRRAVESLRLKAREEYND